MVKTPCRIFKIQKVKYNIILNTFLHNRPHKLHANYLWYNHIELIPNKQKNHNCCVHVNNNYNVTEYTYD